MKTSQAQSGQGTDRRAVLVIDDESSVSSLLRINLNQNGFAVDTAGSGPQGVARAHTTRYDLVIIDIVMPGMDGVETSSRIRAVGGYEETPIVMISSRADAMTRERARKAGATDFVPKPFRFDELLPRLSDLLLHPFS